MPKTGLLSELEMKQIDKLLNTVAFKSRFHFLDDHKGLRRKELSMILAPKGGSKSTLIRSILIDLAIEKDQTLVILSEEAKNVYLGPLNIAAEEMGCDMTIGNSPLENLHVYHQNDFPKQYLRTTEMFKRYIEEVVITLGIRLIVFDNFTTSFMGRASAGGQQEWIETLKEIAVKWDLVFLVAYHTTKGIEKSKTLFTGEDVRGNMSSSNIAAYIYTVHTYLRANPKRSFVQIDKSRYHPDANKKVYELNFNPKTSLFKSDELSTYEELRDMENGRYPTARIPGRDS